MTAGTVVARHFPWTTAIAGEEVSFRLMESSDGEKVRQFVKGLPEEDLFYLMDDIRDTAGMKRWIDGIRENSIISVLAERSGQLLGYGTLRCGHLQWTRHLGEIRIMMSPEARGKGIGKLLAKEVFAAAHDIGLRRIIARLTSRQTPARYLFQHLGFHIEAVLADCVIDNRGHTQDLIFMSYDVTGFHG
jgi:L-amino acid N-acyltransferase YncA